MRGATCCVAVFASVCLAGCSGSPQPATSSLGALAPPATFDSTTRSTLAFDFGPVLARGQELRHVFTLTNLTKEPVRLLSSFSYAPCCSAVEKLPQTIQAAGAADVTVLLKAGHQTGPKSAVFEIKTDSVEQPVWRLVLRAHPFSEWEISPVGDRVESIPLGRPSTENWRVVCRHKGTEGLPAPDTVESSESIKASFIGPARERTGLGGMVEMIRDVEVALPAIQKTGNHRADVVFRWSGGMKRAHSIRWKIAPLVRLTPSSVVINSPGKPTDRG
jgi:hypothetical protein